MQERARNLQPPHLPAGQIAHLAAETFRKVDARKQFVRALPRNVPAYAMQGGMVEKVLRNREIEVERARLKHHAHAAQGFAGVALDVVAEDPDVPGLHAEQAGNDRKQGALAGTIKSEQRRKASGANGEADIVERLAGPVVVADALYGERSDIGRLEKTGCILAGDRTDGLHHGFAIVMPHGSSPT